MTTTTVTSGYAPVNGLQLYWESRGAGGTPLVMVHGGFGLTTVFGEVLDLLAAGRQVISVELQGHGHTADADRPFAWHQLGDDIAALVRHLGLDQVDLLGNSLGGGAALRAAIQHPSLFRRLVLVSAPCRQDGWLPDVLEGMSHVNSSAFELFKQGPLYAAYAAVAPDVDAFPALMDKTGALLAQPYDWSDEVTALPMPVLLTYGDADSIAPRHMAEFYALLGGGLRDAGWDGSGKSTNRLAVLPDLTHYDIFTSPRLAEVVDRFLS
jgi:pimeloyl-ACP methyl ester carboxylesterase